MDLDQITAEVRETIARCSSVSFEVIRGDTELIGTHAVLKSRELVEALLSLEDFAEERLGCVFDWTSDSAMSRARSVFRTVDVLSQHLHHIQQR